MSNTGFTLTNFQSDNPQDGDLVTFNEASGMYRNQQPSVSPISVFVSPPVIGNGTGLNPITLDPTKAAAGVYAFPSSITLDSTGLVPTIVPGSAPLASPLTTNGDLWTRTAGVNARLGVGGADTFLGSNGTLPSYAVLNKDATLGGTGRSTPLTVSNPLPAAGPANSFLGSNGATASYAVLNKDASISGDGKATALALAVQHDTTLTGLGSVATPLVVTNPLPSAGAADSFLGSNGATASYAVLNKDASISGNGKSTALALAVQHDGSITGLGSVASPLSVTDPVLPPGATNTFLTSNGVTSSYTALSKDASLSGNGVGTPLSVTNPLPSIGAADTFLGSNGSVPSYAVLNKDASISGNGKSTALALSIQHDASLSGAGSVASSLALAVQHDSTLTGLGSVASPLSVTNGTPAPGAANTFLTSNGATSSYTALNKTTAFSGNGVGTALDLATQPNPSAPVGNSATGLVGAQVSINTKGIITTYACLDGSNFGQTGQYTTGYVSFFPQTQNLANNTLVTIKQDSISSASYWNQVQGWGNGPTGVWTIPTTGWYRMTILGTYPDAGGTTRSVRIKGTTSNPTATNFLLAQAQHVDSGTCPAGYALNLDFTYRFTVGDTFVFEGFHNKGSTMNACIFLMSVVFLGQSSP